MSVEKFQKRGVARKSSIGYTIYKRVVVSPLPMALSGILEVTSIVTMYCITCNAQVVIELIHEKPKPTT